MNLELWKNDFAFLSDMPNNDHRIKKRHHRSKGKNSWDLGSDNPLARCYQINYLT